MANQNRHHTAPALTDGRGRYQLWKTNGSTPYGKPEFIYQSDDKNQAQDFCDERNSYLALAGIPSSTCFWYVVDAQKG